jgi:hypothetical protein
VVQNEWQTRKVYQDGSFKGKFQAKGGRNNACNTSQKSVNDYKYYLGSAKEASDYYQTTSEYLINYVKKV